MPKKPEKGNVEKSLAYAMAMNRLESAIEHSFPLEALAIEESIISDRLRAYLEHVKNPQLMKLQTKKGKFLSFGFLIQNLGKEMDRRGLMKVKDYHKLFSDIAKWKDNRNKLLHGIVKTGKAGEPPLVAVGDFSKLAQKTAEEGKDIVRRLHIIRRKAMSFD